MEGSQKVHPFTDSVSEDSGFELNLHRISCEKSSAEDEKFTCTNMTENVVNKIQLASYCCPAIKKDHVIDSEVGIDEIFHLQSSHEQLAGLDPASEEEKVYNSEDIGVCEEFVISDVRLHKCLIKSATFPSSEVESLNLFYTEINGASPSTAAPDQSLSADQIPMYKRSTSLPASSKLVSAIKGGRTQNGTSATRMDMRVKWAEDVYDPPTTSLSHTVKSHNLQRPKYKRKDNNHKQKHNKGKNSRGNRSGKKFPNRGNVCISSPPFPAKLQAGRANGSAGPPEDILEFAAGGGGHDAKCRSSFLRESLAKVHLSFGEPDQQEAVISVAGWWDKRMCMVEEVVL